MVARALPPVFFCCCVMRQQEKRESEGRKGEQRRAARALRWAFAFALFLTVLDAGRWPGRWTHIQNGMHERGVHKPTRVGGGGSADYVYGLLT